MAARQTEPARQTSEAVGFGGTVPAIVASNYKRLDKNTLVGTTDLTVPRWKIVFRGCLWLRKGNKEWINFPAREWIDQAGNKQYADLIKFTNRDTAERFQAAALAAVHRIAGEPPR